MKIIMKALAETHKKLSPIARGTDNPFFHSKYTSLPELYNAIKDALMQNGLWFYHKINSYVPNETEKAIPNGISITSTLFHLDSGEEISCSIVLVPSKNDPQAIGSCISYGKRYTLQAVVGIPSLDEDDDGNAASGIKDKPTNQYEIKKIEYKKEKKEPVKQVKKEDFEKAEENEIPVWMEDQIRHIESVEELEQYYKKYEKSAKSYGNLNSLISACKKRKEEIAVKNEERKKKPVTKRKLDIPEETLSAKTRAEIINELKYYANKVYGEGINILDLFVDDDGNVPGNIDKIETELIEKTLARLKSIE